MNISVPFDVRNFVNSEIELPVRRRIVPLVQQAYELVDECIKDVSFLNWYLGKKHRGYLDNIAVQFTLYEAASMGMLQDISAHIVPNATRSAYHVELKTPNTIVTINRALSKTITARKANYRTILQQDNQFFWDFWKNEVREEPGYLEFTHNHINRKVDFINLGVPNGKGKWFSCIDLTKEIYLVGTPREEEKNTISKEQLVKFKSFAQGVYNDGGKN
ncbi:hypothetical protein ACQKML_24010 [Peribacillus frigoritolerans]